MYAVGCPYEGIQDQEEQAHAGHCPRASARSPFGEGGSVSQLVHAAPNRSITWGQGFQQWASGVEVELAVIRRTQARACLGGE